MKTPDFILTHLHHRAGGGVILLLMLPILAWVWLAARNPVISVLNGTVARWVLSGKIFTESFDIRHAGSSLDQPTIGKWLFWFSVMTASSLPCTALVRWLSDRSRRRSHLVFSISAGVISFFLLCILTWPLLWLMHYVWSMGFTPKRMVGLWYSSTGAQLVILFLIWAARRPPDDEAIRFEPPSSRDGCATLKAQSDYE